MKLQVLDFGYVEFIEAWGTGKDGLGSEVDLEPRDFEVGIIEAARQSTQGGFKGWEGDPCDCDRLPNSFKHSTSCAQVKNPGDAKLLKFLHDNKHATPFEFSGLVIEVQAPIFVFREWHRHRTQSYNEMSARYTPLPDLYYTPTQERVMMGAVKTGNKQAQGTGAELTEETAGYFINRHLPQAYSLCEEIYQASLAAGIPKEIARIVMPVGHYTRMRAAANLRNWLAFLTLRQDPKAQWEIRQYANAVAEVIQSHFPQTYKLFAGEKN